MWPAEVFFSEIKYKKLPAEVLGDTAGQHIANRAVRQFYGPIGILPGYLTDNINNQYLAKFYPI